jgi:hypothetical protein
VVHGREFLHPNILLQSAIESDAEFKRANLKEVDCSYGGAGRFSYKMETPSRRQIQGKLDAAVDEVNGRLGIGIIVRDCNGLVIAARSRTRLGNLEPVAAEALAAF